jgi:phosphoglycerate dehydrogenase-like enzyme
MTASITETTHAEILLNSIRNRTARVGVIGLGYVGLPLALLFEESGFPVTGFDVDAEKAPGGRPDMALFNSRAAFSPASQSPFTTKDGWSVTLRTSMT